jgi:ribosomal protein S18 acetylase RimI-like enzyme
MDPEVFQFAMANAANIDALSSLYELDFEHPLTADEKALIITGPRDFGYLVKVRDLYVGQILCRWVVDFEAYRANVQAGVNQKPFQLCVASVSVLESYRGCGIGRRLLTYVMQQVKRATYFSLHVRVSNETAQRLYKRHGFTVNSTVARYYRTEAAFYMTAPNPNYDPTANEDLLQTRAK